MRPVGVRVRLPAPIPAARSFVATHHVPANPVVAPPDPRPRRRITMSWHSAAAGPLSFVQTRNDLTAFEETRLAQKAAALAMLRDDINAIEAMPAGPAKHARQREIVELLVNEVTIRTEGAG